MFSHHELNLYHSTDGNSLQLAQTAGRIYGHEYVEEKERKGSNLTTDKNASVWFIISYRGEGQWTDQQGAPDLYCLTFRLPMVLTKYVGITPILNSPEYATTIDVLVRDVPDSYLARFHAGMRRLTRDAAEELEARGKIRFYEIPFNFLRKIEPVEFTYKGIRYPQENVVTLDIKTKLSRGENL